MLCDFQNVRPSFFFLKLYFHPNAQTSKWPKWQLKAPASVKPGLQTTRPLSFCRFSFCNLCISEKVQSQMWSTEFSSCQSLKNSFLCRKDMHVYFENKPDDNLAKPRFLAWQIKCQKEKTTLNYHRNSTLKTRVNAIHTSRESIQNCPL